MREQIIKYLHDKGFILHFHNGYIDFYVGSSTYSILIIYDRIGFIDADDEDPENVLPCRHFDSVGELFGFLEEFLGS
jgi:hypothetical protein